MTVINYANLDLTLITLSFKALLPQVELHDFVIKHGIMYSQAAEERKSLEGFDITRVECSFVPFVRHLSDADH